MARADKKILSTIVGSFPKPEYVLRGTSMQDVFDTSGGAFFEIEKDKGKKQFKQLLDRAVRDALTDQEEAGIDIVTDGEERREHYIFYILRCLNGFDFTRMHERVVRKMIKGTMREAYTHLVPGVVSSIRHTGPFLTDDFTYLAAQTNRVAKTTLPGPTTVVDAVHNTFYPSDKELAFAYAQAIRKEVQQLKNSGCSIIQFDDPGLLRDLPRAESWGVEALDACFEGIKGITTTVHVCRSYPDKELEKKGIFYKSDEGYYPYLLDLLQHSAIDQISIEGKQGNLNPSVLKHLGERAVLLGCIDVGTEVVETVDEIIEQAESALAYIKPEQLILAPDCGLVLISRNAAKAKLSRLAQAAQQLNTRF